MSVLHLHPIQIVLDWLAHTTPEDPSPHFLSTLEAPPFLSTPEMAPFFVPAASSFRTNFVVASSPVQITLQGVPVHPVMNPEADGYDFGLLLTMPFRQGYGQGRAGEGGGGQGRAGEGRGGQGRVGEGSFPSGKDTGG